MNDTKRSAMIARLESGITKHRAAVAACTADDRADEAVFAKIQMNVYNIFLTVFSVGIKRAGNDDEKLRQFFLARLDQIPQSWQASLSAATEHGDTGKAHIERLKLNAAGEIRQIFSEIWEEAQ